MSAEKKKNQQSLGAFVAEKDQARFEENAEVTRANRTLRAKVKDLEEREQALVKELGLFRSLEEAVVTPAPWDIPASTDKHEAVVCLAISDPHRGADIDPKQVDGINKFNPAIHDIRMERAFTQAIKLTRGYLSGVKYAGCQLFLPGDMISGSIHEELLETNAETVTESILGAVEPLVSGVRLVAKEFGRVHIACTVGNHGRTTRTPRAKFRSASSYDWLVYKFAQRLTEKEKNITWQIPDAADCAVTVYGTRYLLTHGDQFHGGSGISGILSPLLLGAHRKTRRASVAGRPYDIMVFGHFHQEVWFPAKGLIGCGCICGYDEYAYVNNMEPEPAKALLWLTTPEHGVTVHTPVFVTNKKREGW